MCVLLLVAYCLPCVVRCLLRVDAADVADVVVDVVVFVRCC